MLAKNDDHAQLPVPTSEPCQDEHDKAFLKPAWMEVEDVVSRFTETVQDGAHALSTTVST